MIVKPRQLPEVGNLGASPLGDSHSSWGARCVDKYLAGRNSKLGFTVGVSQRENSGEVPTRCFRVMRGFQLVPRCKLIKSCALQQQLGKYAVKTLPGRNWEVGTFICSLWAVLGS